MSNALIAEQARPLKGNLRVPGDKSISHRGLIIAALARGKSTISGLLESEDVLRTLHALRRLNTPIERKDPGLWQIEGCGENGFREPDDVLDLGNAGTAARLLTGVLCGCPFLSFLSGDKSLRSRPMDRVITPLEEMGARFFFRSGKKLPLVVAGQENLSPISYRLPVPSAQVKSAILFAAMKASGTTTIEEPLPSRDHTERMLSGFGVPIEVKDGDNGSRLISLAGGHIPEGRSIAVPGDISSAAFPLIAGLLVPDSRIRLENVGMNPLRTGLLETLEDMGANIETVNRREIAGEPVADLDISASTLNGVDVPAERAPTMIDEYPVLAVAAACANGTSRFWGLSELQHKESDRMSAILHALKACGVDARREEGDTLVVHGTGRPPHGEVKLSTGLDHRMAMAFLVLGSVSESPVAIADGTAIATSFPDFIARMNRLGAAIRPEKEKGEKT